MIEWLIGVKKMGAPLVGFYYIVGESFNFHKLKRKKFQKSIKTQ